jgi:hypothetical protein
MEKIAKGLEKERNSKLNGHFKQSKKILFIFFIRKVLVSVLSTLNVDNGRKSKIIIFWESNDFPELYLIFLFVLCLLFVEFEIDKSAIEIEGQFVQKIK